VYWYGGGTAAAVDATSASAAASTNAALAHRACKILLEPKALTRNPSRGGHANRRVGG
jgi:hypothetical protein